MLVDLRCYGCGKQKKSSAWRLNSLCIVQGRLELVDCLEHLLAEADGVAL